MTLAIIVTVVFLLLAGGATLRAYFQAAQADAAYRAHFVPYRTARDLTFRVWFQGTPHPRMAFAFTSAVDTLEQVWPAAKVEDALRDIAITVNAGNDWVDGYGRRVGGLALDNGGVAVGADLAALAHEFAHVCERKIDRRIDETHVGWEAKGIAAAVALYGERLRGTG